MGISPAIIAAAISAAAAIGTTVYTQENQPKPPKPPQTPPTPTLSGAPQAGTEAALKLLPSVKANSAAAGAGGASPSFFEAQLGQQLGLPTDQLNVLDQIKSSIGQGGGGIQGGG